MNAALLARSARALILATGLIASSSIIGYAQDAPLPLGPQATLPLSVLYLAPPTGQATLGGHLFDLSGGNMIQLANGGTVSFSGSYPNAKAVYLLLNTFNTYSFYLDTVVGQVVLTFSDGTSQTTDLVVGGNIREWRTGAGNTVNDTSDPAAAQVWTGSANGAMGGGSAVIDMLTIAVPTTGKTLTTVTLNDTNTWGALKIDLSGATVDYTAPIPTPAPTPTTTCGKANHNGKLVAEKSQGCLHRADQATIAQDRKTTGTTAN